MTRTITYKGETFKVKGNALLPDLQRMDHLSARIWIVKNTYARGYQKYSIQLPAIELKVK